MTVKELINTLLEEDMDAEVKLYRKSQSNEGCPNIEGIHKKSDIWSVLLIPEYVVDNDLIDLLTDPENQPHQYVGDFDKLKRDIDDL